MQRCLYVTIIFHDVDQYWSCHTYSELLLVAVCSLYGPTHI